MDLSLIVRIEAIDEENWRQSAIEGGAVQHPNLSNPILRWRQKLVVGLDVSGAEKAFSFFGQPLCFWALAKNKTAVLVRFWGREREAKDRKSAESGCFSRRLLWRLRSLGTSAR